MMEIDVQGILEGIANRGLANQKRGKTDFIGSDGMLMCGVCGEYKQRIMEFPDPTEDAPDKIISFKVACLCRCEQEREEEENRREQARKDMELIASLRSASLMDERFSEATFDQFEINKDNERNLKLCRRYVERFDLMVEKNQGLLFWGDVGTGKTFASACIANALLSKKIPVMMTSFVKLLSIIQNGEERDSTILDRMKRAKLVIFDDLGAERGTEYALEKVYGIVDARYRQKLPTIFCKQSSELGQNSPQRDETAVMKETTKGILADLRSLKQRLIMWLIKKLLGRNALKSPVDILWDMIDEENSKEVTFSDGPDCTKIEAWQEAAARIGRECFGLEVAK